MLSIVAYHRLRKSDDAKVLEDQIAAFATQWVMDWSNQASVPEELAVIHKLTEAALARAAEAWNRRHHALRKLPLEIFELCWSFLDTPDLIRVAATCKVFRRIIHDAPALWTDLTFRRVRPHSAQLTPLLERSKGSLFGLSVQLYGRSGALHLANVLRPHAHRLRRLELRAHKHFGHGEPVLMEFSAPELRAFVCELPSLSFLEGNFIFSGPNLERMEVVTLALGQRVPPMRFARVTSLTFGWKEGSLNGLYDAFPSLTILEIIGIEREGYYRSPRPPLDLPRDRPPPPTLQRVVLRGLRSLELSYADLVAFGFRSVNDLEIHGRRPEFDDTLTLFDSLGCTPRSAEMQGRHLFIRADSPRKLCVAFELYSFEQYFTVLSRPAVRANITTLVFKWPQRDGGCDPDYGFPSGDCRFPSDDFPSLATLVLPVGHPLLELSRRPARGKLRAPALRCLAIIDAARDGVASSVEPLCLALFIARRLDLAPGRKLDELVLDGDYGVTLCEPEHEYDNGLDVLRNHVCSISHKYYPENH